MTVTYTDRAIRNTSVEADNFVPRYARARRAKKGVRTWMILAPIGALVLIGGGAAIVFFVVAGLLARRVSSSKSG